MQKKSQNINQLIRRAAANGGGQAGQTLVRRLTFSGTIANGLGARMRTTDVTSCQEWSAATGIYSEYRVLAIKLHLVSVPTNAAGGHVVTGIDRSGALAVPGTAQIAFGLQNAKVHSVPATGNVKTIYVEARAVDLEDQLFSAVTTAPSNFAVQWYNGSTQTVTYFAEFMVEFRGLTG